MFTTVGTHPFVYHKVLVNKGNQLETENCNCGFHSILTFNKLTSNKTLIQPRNISKLLKVSGLCLFAKKKPNPMLCGELVLDCMFRLLKNAVRT